MNINIKNVILKLLYSKGFMKYFYNTSWLFAEKALRLIAGLFVGIYVARYLGPEQYGLFSYALAFVSMFGSVAKLGLDSIVVRDLVSYPAQRDSRLGTAFWLKVFGAVIMLGIIIISLQFTGNDAITNYYILIIATGIIFQSFEVVDFYFQSKVLLKFVSFSRIGQLLLSSIFKLILIYFQADLIWFVLVILFDHATLALFLTYAYWKQQIGFFIAKFNIEIAKEMLSNSWPLIFSGLVLMVQARIDQVMLKEFIGSEEVGYYSVAMRLIEVFAFVPMALKSSLLPSFTDAKLKSEKLYKSRLFSFYKIMMIISLLVGLPIYFLGSNIVELLYGHAYQPAGYLFSLMAIRLFFANYGVARGIFILNENLFKFSMITMIIGTIVNIGLNILLIPQYEAVGAIWATIVSFIVTVFLIDFFYPKTRDNSILMFKSMFKFYDLRGDFDGLS